MFQVVFTEQAEQDILNLPRRTASAVADRLEWLAVNAEAVIHHRLKGRRWGKAYRLRLGDYRVIYQLSRDEERITVLRIGNRKDVYGN